MAGPCAGSELRMLNAAPVPVGLGGGLYMSLLAPTWENCRTTLREELALATADMRLPRAFARANSCAGEHLCTALLIPSPLVRVARGTGTFLSLDWPLTAADEHSGRELAVESACGPPCVCLVHEGQTLAIAPSRRAVLPIEVPVGHPVKGTRPAASQNLMPELLRPMVSLPNDAGQLAKRAPGAPGAVIVTRGLWLASARYSWVILDASEKVLVTRKAAS
mmetsp:Transcript_138384/g.386007  ORF Transcript_138384/g.386007 Transcript_138384/m.386007 type:complete len:221 (+) Transcript_138384:123-785(+)